MIRIAIQSKGRLNEQSVELLQDAGLNVNDQKRKFLDRVDNFPIEILYLRDDDIPAYLKDSSYGGEEDKANSRLYKYPHAYGGYVEQQYLPDSLRDRVDYKPGKNGYENEVKETRKRKGKKD